MKNLIEQIREMVEKSRKTEGYPTALAEPFIGYSVECPNDERKLFTVIADRIEREYVELPLDADGVPIKLSDKVFFVGSYEPHEVFGFLFEYGEALVHIGRRDKTSTDAYVKPEELAHKPIDTLESIENDARKSYPKYWKCSDAWCDNCPAIVDGKKPHERYATNEDCENAKALDLLRRMREALERE